MPSIRSLVLLLSVALAATLAHAQDFTFPTFSLDLRSGTQVNVAWSIPDANATTATSASCQSTAATVASSTSHKLPRRYAATESSLRSAGAPRSDADVTSTSAESTTTSAKESSTSPCSTSAASTASATSSATSSATAASTSATAAPNDVFSGFLPKEECANGMPVYTGAFARDPWGSCSVLQLYLAQHVDKPFMSVKNFNLSAGWLPMFVPYVPESQEYTFVLYFWYGNHTMSLSSSRFSISQSDA